MVRNYTSFVYDAVTFLMALSELAIAFHFFFFFFVSFFLYYSLSWLTHFMVLSFNENGLDDRWVDVGRRYAPSGMDSMCRVQGLSGTLVVRLNYSYSSSSSEAGPAFEVLMEWI